MARFVLIGITVLTAMAPLAIAGETALTGKRPNIIFLMDDQHRCDAVGNWTRPANAHAGPPGRRRNLV